MGFKFETANERWSWFKNADKPYALEQKQNEFDYDSLGALPNELYEAVAQQFGVSEPDYLLQAAQDVLHGGTPSDNPQVNEVANFIDGWIKERGWTTEGYPLDSLPHDEFPYRKQIGVTAAKDDTNLAAVVQDIVNKTFCLYMTAHKYHWNTVGPDFPEFHEFFGEIYQDAIDAIDHLAELILMLGEKADLEPGKIGKAVTPSDMIRDLLKKTEELIEDITKAVEQATDAGEHAVANDLADRLGAHQKWAWQLRSTK